MALAPDSPETTKVISQIREADNVGIKVFLRGGGDPNTRNNMGWTLLHLACLEGQAEISETLLDAGAMVNCCTTEMVTPLHLAATKGNRTTVEVLVKKGAYINAQDKAGNTPLHEAAKSFHTGIVSFLLEKKADKQKINKKNQTFLHLVGQQMMAAVEGGDIDILVEWLGWGLDPNTSGNLNWSILHHAAARGQINIASLLLEKGGNVNILDSNKSSPLHASSFHGHKRIVELLLAKGANINCQDQRGNTPLHSAITGGHPDIINLLLENGSDTSIPNFEGQGFSALVSGLLVEAVEKGRVNHVVSLLKGKANPNTKDSSGFPILCCASFKGDVVSVDALLAAGADANLCFEGNLKTPLHYGAAVGNLFVLKSLLDKNASVLAKDRSGLTPLHEAAREGAYDEVTVLIGRNSALDAQDVEGNTPLHAAARWGHTQVVELLIEKGATENIRNNDGMLYSDLALLRAARTQNAEQVVSGLAWGGNPDTQDTKGWSLLHHAVYKSSTEVCSVLLASEANVNIQDKQGRTPLFFAAYRGNIEIMESLLNAGANLDIQDNSGRTALHWAAEEGTIDTIELLLNRGADRNIRTKDGHLFSKFLLKHLYFAVRHNDANKVESLLRAGADQTAVLYGTEITPREEAKRRKLYPILQKMVNFAAPNKTIPRNSKEDLVALEDIRTLFEDREDGDDSLDETSSSDSSEEMEDDINEDAYWRMHNAPIVISAKELFADEENAFWENWQEKPIVLSAKEVFKQKEAWWESSSSSDNNSFSSDQSDSEESIDDPVPTFEETKKKWGNVIPAKDFFREDECWWRDAVEEIDKPDKVISAKEFFKDDVPWWDQNSSDEEKDLETKEEPKPIPAKEFFKEETDWWERNSSDEEKASDDEEEELKKEERSEEEISVYEDIEESLTEDWDTANDSILSDSSTMYSVSEGEGKIMASELFATKPWWDEDDGSGESSSMEDELSNDESDGTEIEEDSSITEKEKFTLRRIILSSTESDASTNIILEDNADDESIGNVFDLDDEELAADGNNLCLFDEEQSLEDSNDFIKSLEKDSKDKEILDSGDSKTTGTEGANEESIGEEYKHIKENSSIMRENINQSIVRPEYMHCDNPHTTNWINSLEDKSDFLEPSETHDITNDYDSIEDESKSDSSSTSSGDNNLDMKSSQKEIIEAEISSNSYDSVEGREEGAETTSHTREINDTTQEALIESPTVSNSEELANLKIGDAPSQIFTDEKLGNDVVGNVTLHTCVCSQPFTETLMVNEINTLSSLQADDKIHELTVNSTHQTASTAHEEHDFENNLPKFIENTCSDFTIPDSKPSTHKEENIPRLQDNFSSKFNKCSSASDSNIIDHLEPDKEIGFLSEGQSQHTSGDSESNTENLSLSQPSTHGCDKSEDTSLLENHSNDENGKAVDEEIAQTHSLKLKFSDDKPAPMDSRGKNTKYTDEKLVTLKKPIVNKMDACLARLDASLAWLDERMKRGENKIPNPNTNRGNNFNSYSDGHITEHSPKFSKQFKAHPSSNIRVHPDSFRIFRVKVRIPEQHIVKPVECYQERDSKPSELNLKGSSSENALYDGIYDVTHCKDVHKISPMQKYNSLAKLESVFPCEQENKKNDKNHVDKNATGDSLRFKDTQKMFDPVNSSSFLADHHRSLDFLSLLTDTLPDIGTNASASTKGTATLRRHNSDEIRTSTSKDVSFHGNYEEDETRLFNNTLSDVSFRKGYFSHCKRANPIPERRYSSDEIHNCIYNPRINNEVLTSEELKNKKQIKFDPVRPDKYIQTNHNDINIENNTTLNSCTHQTNTLRIPKDSKTVDDVTCNENVEQIYSNFKGEFSLHDIISEDLNTCNLNEPKLPNETSDRQPTNETKPTCESKIIPEKSTDLSSPFPSHRSSNDGINKSDTIPSSSSSCSSLDDNPDILTLSESPNKLDLEMNTPFSKSSWRWSTFDPRTLNEYDHIVNSFTNTSPPLRPTLRKRSRSTNSVEDAPLRNEQMHRVSQGVGHNAEAVFLTNPLEVQSNLSVKKPPIPPRRNRDSRLNVASDERLSDQRLNPQKDIDDICLSHHSGQPQKHNVEECTDSGIVPDIDTGQTMPKYSLDQTPKPPPRRSAKRSECVVKRSSSCSLC